MTSKITQTIMILTCFIMCHMASFALPKSQKNQSETNTQQTQQKHISTMYADITVSTVAEFNTAISNASAGDIIYIKNGNYVFTSRVSISRSGTAGNLISVLPHPDNTTRPFFDFSSMSESSSNRAISLGGNYWHFKGIDIFGAGDNGMFIGGNNNTIEFCTFSECKDTGLQIGSGGSNNTIINCDSFYNADASLENADGFACKLDAGTGNKFVGCRAWQNLDDGWDGYLRGTDNITTTYENCWAIKNGYLKNGSAGQGDGNGFKTGGSDAVNNIKLLKHNAIYKNCISAGNIYDGFDHNSNRGSITMYNCGAYQNGRNINFSSSNIAEKLEIKNTISYAPTSGSDSYRATTLIVQNNSWQNGLTTNNSDFESLDINLLLAERKADGSLPDVEFMKLVAGSDLIDAGMDVGLPFNGTAPDIGPFETGTLGINDFVFEAGIANYPNPFSEETRIIFNLKQALKLNIAVYNLMGIKVFDFNDKTYPAGNNTLTLKRNNLASGNYLLVLKGEDQLRTSKLITIK
ncbi:right-handed parallel beta-helix repeat-containing protein [Tamlana sp. I1]|uniref:right-handed parallel beta-helix repeat-containing protein n=1 Tax=Tamlana sp. I1 TaxID=2762061 RepID=UPI00188DC84A|nr:T9SS type A sorting domain-containing protein [Tamlana sp. I1]